MSDQSEKFLERITKVLETAILGLSVIVHDLKEIIKKRVK